MPNTDTGIAGQKPDKLMHLPLRWPVRKIWTCSSLKATSWCDRCSPRRWTPRDSATSASD